MTKLISKILFALIWDEKAAKRWIRGIIGVMAACGAAFGDRPLKIACVVVIFSVAAHGDPLKPRSKLKTLQPSVRIPFTTP